MDNFIREGKRMRERINTTGIYLGLFSICIFIFGIYGWVWNIIKIAQGDVLPLTGLMVLRIIGVFLAPIGSVLGYL